MDETTWEDLDKEYWKKIGGCNYYPQFINKTGNIGCVVPDNGSYKAKLTHFKKNYYFYNPNEDKCWDWLYARRIELLYGLNLTELDIKKYIKRNNIKMKDNGRFFLEIVINKVRTCKTFDTYEEAEDYVKILISK